MNLQSICPFPLTLAKDSLKGKARQEDGRNKACYKTNAVHVKLLLAYVENTKKKYFVWFRAIAILINGMSSKSLTHSSNNSKAQVNTVLLLPSIPKSVNFKHVYSVMQTVNLSS